MKNHPILILAASLILGISFVWGCRIVSSERRAGNEEMMQAMISQMQLTAQRQETVQEDDDSPVLTLAEAGALLRLTGDQVLNIIKAESSILSNNGVYVGERLPYIKVDDQFLINRELLMSWLSKATLENRVYSGTTRLQ
ncbi:hypothetical protein [Paenibacillus tepidiphilus]|uniref:hypothetical protein n=1 Tax=Paenibacillus tepidiphilus TaxID=2608683 RepID=UPI001239E2C5|nr:hypothetical protein [Paenibacillus tepidiphilus]